MLLNQFCNYGSRSYKVHQETHYNGDYRQGSGSSGFGLGTAWVLGFRVSILGFRVQGFSILHESLSQERDLHPES